MTAKLKKYLVFLLIITTIFSLTIVNTEGRISGQTDADYANFRNVKTGKLGKNALFRSQHPANGSARSYYANKFAQQYHIQTVLNLSDSKSSLLDYFKKKNISSSYYYRILYNKGKVYTAHMPTKHTTSAYRTKVAATLKFMARNKGPYLVHCEVGRDRTGFVILLLASLMSGSYDYMLEDYTKAFMNTFGYSYSKSRTKSIAHLNEEFSYMTGLHKSTNWKKINLAAYAAKYLRKGGMSSSEIIALQRNLAISYPITTKYRAVVVKKNNVTNKTK